MIVADQTSPQPVVACWSGGKDSALMLARLQSDPRYQVVGLMTMVTAGDLRINMHGVAHELLCAQAAATGLPLVTAEIPTFPANALYEAAFAKAVDRFRSLGVQTIAFGDLFLADIRAYREQLCQRIGLQALFPLWGENTTALAAEFIARGFSAVVCCADASKLSSEYVGGPYDAEFLRRLPAEIDPCGENGEFHTFVTTGPILSQPVSLNIGATGLLQGFWYSDLQPPVWRLPETTSSHRRPLRVPCKERTDV